MAPEVRLAYEVDLLHFSIGVHGGPRKYHSSWWVSSIRNEFSRYIHISNTGVHHLGDMRHSYRAHDVLFDYFFVLTSRRMGVI